MENTRAFIACPAPAEWKEIINREYAALRSGIQSRISWVRPENMHFTLKFLGTVTAEKLAEVDATLSKIDIKKFDISTGGSGYFPAPAKPHVIWLGLAGGAAEFCSMAAGVESAMRDLGFERNRKSCHAHLTFGRIKKNAGDDWPGLLDKINNLKLPPSRICGFTLYKSVLKPSGPEYSVLKEYC